MKKLIYLFVFIGIHGIVFSQAKPADGIYLIDQSDNRNVGSQQNRAVVQFNPLFVGGDPEEYNPIVIYTNDFVPLELTNIPIVQYRKGQENLLLVHLTENATEKLRTFTMINMMNNIVVVIDGEAIAIYKVIRPVTNNLIEIAKCNTGGCNQIYERLKRRWQFKLFAFYEKW